MKCGQLELIKVNIFSGEPPYYSSNLYKEVNKVLQQFKEREFIQMWILGEDAYLLIGGE